MIQLLPNGKEKQHHTPALARLGFITPGRGNAGVNFLRSGHLSAGTILIVS
jgi:hypothetical protein